MSKHLFRLVFGAFFLVAATAFTGCSDDDDKSLTPKLTADPTALDFTDETATTQTVAITANCEWTVTASNLDWATISPMSGKGNGTISVTVSELPAGTNLREGKISFTLIHPEFGKWGQAESSVAVKQYGSGVTPPPTGDAIYANDFDKEQAQKGADGKFPFADAFEGWKNQTGTGADNVAYKTSGISVCSNSPSNDSHSKYKDDASGVNNMFFGTSGVFEIQKIALESTQKNLQLTFGSYRSIRSIFEDKDNAFKTSEFHVYLSKDGENWAEITYDRPVGDDEHWALATANFTLKQVPSELYIKFTSDLTSAHRIDDVKLFEGIGGTEVDLDNITPPVTEPKITKLDPTSLSFAATDNAKTVTVTAANADDCTIEAATDKSEQFTTSVNGMVVTVTPKENTTEQAITATLTIKLMKAGAAVDTKTVAISQAGKSVPGGSGYTRVNAIAAGKKYLVVAEVNSKYVVMPAAAAMTSSKFTGVDITVSGGKIESNEANDAYAVTIEANGDAYVIKNSAGKYIEHNSGTNFKLADTSSKTWTITYDNDKNWFAIMDVATSTEKTKRQLLYQIEDGSTSNRFGPYASSNADGVKYSGVALYELSE